MTEPTTERLLEQLRATHHGPDLVDVAACVVAGAKAWHTGIQRDRRDAGRLRPDGQLWAWEDMTPHDQAALVALVGPVVEAALAELQRPVEVVHVRSVEPRRPCSCCPDEEV